MSWGVAEVMLNAAPGTEVLALRSWQMAPRLCFGTYSARRLQMLTVLHQPELSL